MEKSNSSSVVDATLTEIAFLFVMIFLIGASLQIWERSRSEQFEEPTAQGDTDERPAVPSLVNVPLNLADQLVNIAQRLNGSSSTYPCFAKAHNWVVTLDNGHIPEHADFCSESSLRHVHLNPLFASGSSRPSKGGMQCAKDLCLSLFDVWHENRDKLSAVIIEGHASSNWDQQSVRCPDPETQAFACNMALSVERAASIWALCYSHVKEKRPRKFDEGAFADAFIIHGRSSTKPVQNLIKAGRCENPVASRRVVFKMQVRPPPHQKTDQREEWVDFIHQH